MWPLLNTKNTEKKTMNKDIYRLKINDKFANVAPSLSDEEYCLLKESLLKDGCIDPIVVWNGMIVDGHNRYHICRQNRIPFAIEEKNFSTESEAIQWIIQNQLGRRNLSPFSKCEMVLRYEPQLKTATDRQEGVSQKRSTGDMQGPKRDTRDIPGVSHSTKATNDFFSDINDAVNALLKQVSNGEVSQMDMMADLNKISKMIESHGGC